MRRVRPRTFECIGKTAGLAKLVHGLGLNSPSVLAAENAVMFPSGVPASVSASGTVTMPACWTLSMWSMSDMLVMSQALFRCTVAKSSALPSSEGDVTVDRRRRVDAVEAGETEKFAGLTRSADLNVVVAGRKRADVEREAGAADVRRDEAQRLVRIARRPRCRCRGRCRLGRAGPRDMVRRSEG